ncbi:hypothetical protein [Mesorhizobium dulcispinae]|uniref:hypothetical protein n=1 Tax=Mesorhizobium dulcispinae TaxID=3072316 RepID=UPI002A24AF05|nr:hypothetical protein [Mesorhizobium sp. VK23D]MDX8516866.1 hypothetical protein [Mesorhizobium sp. VK23D]
MFLATGLAQASSIVVLDVATSTPSIVRLPAIAPGEVSAASTPSVVALGEPVPAVTDEKVAAIPEKSGQRHAQAPTIIRGGIVGGASAAPAAAKPTAPATTTPAKGTAPAAATPPNGTAAVAPNGDTKAADTKAAADNKAAATASASDDQAQPEAKPQEPPIAPRFSKAM